MSASVFAPRAKMRPKPSIMWSARGSSVKPVSSSISRQCASIVWRIFEGAGGEGRVAGGGVEEEEGGGGAEGGDEAVGFAAEGGEGGEEDGGGDESGGEGGGGEGGPGGGGAEAEDDVAEQGEAVHGRTRRARRAK